ncbi:hypothetical protein B1L11_16775 [Microbispora sp. GKU 823]|nr:hypothetical protein B1L11_16775 [Microbispora sp. GKU 823]
MGFSRAEPGAFRTSTSAGSLRRGDVWPLMWAWPRKWDVSMPKCLRRRLMWAWAPPDHGMPR